MAGSAMPTTVASRAAMPEPSTVAATTHRPRALFIRRARSGWGAVVSLMRHEPRSVRHNSRSKLVRTDRGYTLPSHLGGFRRRRRPGRAGARGQDRTAQDQHKGDADRGGQVLAEDQDAERDRDGGVDVGDDGGA